MQFCRRCLYPSIHPLGLAFDAEGICSGCRVHEEKDRLDWVEREHRLADLLADYRGRTRGRYDCIVPVSGGRDSFFIVHLVRKVYGLNPLLVVYNRHYNTRAGIYNLARLRTALGCDITTLTLDPELVKRVMRTTLAELGSFHWHALAGHTVLPVQTAVRINVPLIIWGAHQGLEQVGMFSHLDEVEMTRRYRREHDLMGLDAAALVDKGEAREADLLPFFYPHDADLRRTGVRGIYLGNYIRWDTKAQHERMVALYDYYTGPLARTFDCYNDVDDQHYAGLHDAIKVAKYGYGVATDHACREIRFGRLTRDEGLALAARFRDRAAVDGTQLLEFLGVDWKSFDALINARRHPAAWTRADGAWQPTSGIERGLRSVPTDGRDPDGCRFLTHFPRDFAAPAYDGQLLTRGYARE
jgi:N-acetyl sugar amidotransferase